MIMKLINWLFCVMMCTLLVACTSAVLDKTDAKNITIAPDNNSVTSKSAYTEEGIASWYGGASDKLNNKRTASGEIYNNKALSAAHKTLPTHSKVKVTNLRNNKSVVVVINDRGPFVKDRIIDLSKAAAQVLGFLNDGVTMVKIEYIGKAEKGIVG